ncbi:hypothetical protein ACFYRD_39715 [Streptomyces hirsutus]|uniref:hypothetical protein n=1 Tax=Streptomyces hirsutus TaxID=35620 RepID=UPI0036B4703C
MTEYGDLNGKVVAVDFDGVLHSYTSGWTGYVPVDPPEPGALRFVHWLIGRGAEVVIVSSRANRLEGAEAIRAWLRTHGFPELEVTHVKVRAVGYVDDRAVPYAPGHWDECKARVSLLSGSYRNE